MDSPRVRLNRNAVLQRQRKTTSLSGWSVDDELVSVGDQRGHRHRHGPLNYDYDFPIEKWFERRVAAEKRQNGPVSMTRAKRSAMRWKHATKQPPSKPPSTPPSKPANHLLTLCSLINHCEAIADFEQFKGHGLIGALVTRPARPDSAQNCRGSVTKAEANDGEAAPLAMAGSFAERVQRDAGDDESRRSEADHEAEPSSKLGRTTSSVDPEEWSREADRPRTSSSGPLRNTPTSYSDTVENINSNSVGRSRSVLSSSASSLEGSPSAMFPELESKFASREEKPVLPVRFYYTRLNAAVQDRLNHLNQYGSIASLVWKGPVRPPLPLLTSPAIYHHNSTAVVQSTPSCFRPRCPEASSSSARSSLTATARSPTGNQTTDALTSGSLSSPMTKKGVVAALTRARFQTEGTNASGIILPSVLPPNRQVTREPCAEQEREASAEIVARGQTCVVHYSSSVDTEAVSKTQLFHIGDLLRAMDCNQKREISMSHYFASATDVGL